MTLKNFKKRYRIRNKSKMMTGRKRRLKDLRAPRNMEQDMCKRKKSKVETKKNEQKQQTILVSCTILDVLKYHSPYYLQIQLHKYQTLAASAYVEICMTPTKPQPVTSACTTAYYSRTTDSNAPSGDIDKRLPQSPSFSDSLHLGRKQREEEISRIFYLKEV